MARGESRSAIETSYAPQTFPHFAFLKFGRTFLAGGQMKNLEKVKELARDLRREEPRSSYEELGGEPHAARTLDKARATLAGTNGEYQFGCPMDQHFFEETGINIKQFEDYVATGASDEEVGEWIQQHRGASRR